MKDRIQVRSKLELAEAREIVALPQKSWRQIRALARRLDRSAGGRQPVASSRQFAQSRACIARLAR